MSFFEEEYAADIAQFKRLIDDLDDVELSLSKQRESPSRDRCSAEEKENSVIPPVSPLRLRRGRLEGPNFDPGPERHLFALLFCRGGV